MSIKSIPPALVAPACATLGILTLLLGTDVALDAGHALSFVLSLSCLQFCTLRLAGLGQRALLQARPVRIAAVGAASLLAVLLHKFFVSPFLIVPLRQDALVLGFLLLAWPCLSLLDALGASPRDGAAKPAGRRAALKLLLAMLGLRFHWLALALIAGTLWAQRSGLQVSYRDELLRRWAGYPLTQPSSISWTLEPLAEELSFEWPIEVLEDPDRESVLYVLERAGKLQRVDRASEPASKTCMLDLRSQVGPIEGELGALAAAFHPRCSSLDASAYQYIYIYYTTNAHGRLTNRLSRFDVNWPELRIEAHSELILIDQVDRDFWHNGGGLAFGPEGYLYLGMGDEGGSEADILDNSQRIDRNLFSGILRIDVDQLGGDLSHAIVRQPAAGQTANYFIPNDNPFVGRAGALEEFWALGLRNPSRLSFDAEGGDLWVTDVGGSLYEEINLAQPGSNFGWVRHEGPRRLGADPAELLGVPSAPVFAYPHAGFRVCVIGGVLYRGSLHPALQGSYVYADYGSGEVFALRLQNGRPQANEVLTESLAHLDLQCSSLQEVRGEIMLTSIAQNQVYRLVQTKDATPRSPRPAPSALESFQVLCARCHGSEGQPEAAAAELSQRSARNLTDPFWQNSVSDAHIERIIRKGGMELRPDSAMPSWEDALSDEQIEAFVRVIRSFKR